MNRRIGEGICGYEWGLPLLSVADVACYITGLVRWIRGCCCLVGCGEEACVGVEWVGGGSRRGQHDAFEGRVLRVSYITTRRVVHPSITGVTRPSPLHPPLPLSCLRCKLTKLSHCQHAVTTPTTPFPPCLATALGHSYYSTLVLSLSLHLFIYLSFQTTATRALQLSVKALPALVVNKKIKMKCIRTRFLSVKPVLNTEHTERQVWL